MIFFIHPQNITWTPTKIHTNKTPSIKPKTILRFQSKHFQDLYSQNNPFYITQRPTHFFAQIVFHLLMKHSKGKYATSSNLPFRPPIPDPSPTLPRQARVLRLTTETTRTNQAFGLLLLAHRFHPPIPTQPPPPPGGNPEKSCFRNSQRG